MKILGQKAYGHIPHLPGSRIGRGDHKVNDGLAKLFIGPLMDKSIEKIEKVVVEAKLDGSCMAVYKESDILYPLTRSGHMAVNSTFYQHKLFYNWVMANQDRFMDLLDNEERVVGEWLALAHGTRYKLLHEPFVTFDIMKKHERLPSWELRERLKDFVQPTVLIEREGPISIDEVIPLLKPYHGEIDPVEGAVWRLHRKMKNGSLRIDIAKYIRPDKVDGQYLFDGDKQRPDNELIWNWKP